MVIACDSLKRITHAPLAIRPCRAFLRGTVAGRGMRFLLPAKMRTPEQRKIHNKRQRLWRAKKRVRLKDGTYIHGKKHVRIDETGKRYFRLHVLKFDCVKNNTAHWLCKCDCGTVKSIAGPHLRFGKTRSCGCFFRDVAKVINKTHGYASNGEISSTYKIWVGMKKRCLNVNDRAFKYYGGRGIKVCERWVNSFENFLADMGERPVGKSLGRINNDGNYCPENCRWETDIQQANNSRNCRYINFGGKIQPATAWAHELGLAPSVLLWRLNNDWTIEQAFTTPQGHTFGQSHPLSKLTDDIVKIVRAEYKPHSRTNGAAALSRRYGVGKTIMHQVIKRERWAHVL
jgi:hypothetical protein